MPACRVCGGAHSHLEGPALVRHEQLYARPMPPWADATVASRARVVGHFPAGLQPVHTAAHDERRLILTSLGERILSQRG